MQHFAGFMSTLVAWLLLFVFVYTVDAQTQPPAVIWYAPFLSGGGYCSEAHSYVTSISAALRSISEAEVAAIIDALEAQDGNSHAGSSSLSYDSTMRQQQEEEAAADAPPFALYVTQHGDSFNAAFIRDIPPDMRELLEEVWLPPSGLHCVYALQLLRALHRSCASGCSHAR